MPLSLSAVRRRPERLVSEPAQCLLGEFRNPRGYALGGAIIEPHSNCVMLEPVFNPADYAWGIDDYKFAGATADEFLEVEYVFGQPGTHIMRTITNDATPWAAQLASDGPTIASFRGIWISFFWWRPLATMKYADVDFWPRIDHTVINTATGGGLAPIMFSIDGNFNFDVFEVPWTTEQEWIDAPLEELWWPYPDYRHALHSRERSIGPYNRWLTMWVQPIDEMQFVVSADWLEGGGFLYRSQHEHEFDLFPEGGAGIRLDAGGAVAWQICPCEYKTVGNLMSDLQTRAIVNTRYPDIRTKEYLGHDGSAVDVILVDGSGEEIIEGDEIDTWAFAAKLSSANGYDTPRLFAVEVDWDVAVTEPEADVVDISADVMSFDLGLSADDHGRSGKLRLRNPGTPGEYDDWLQEAVQQIDLSIHGTALAKVFTQNPKFAMWLIGTQPEREIPVIEFDIVDTWGRLETEIVKDGRDYAEWNLSDAIEDLLLRAGFAEEDLDIDPLAFQLPRNTNGESSGSRPSDGMRLSELLTQWHDEYASTWIMRIDAAGKFLFKQPGAVEVARVFYRSLTEGNEVYQVEHEAWQEAWDAWAADPESLPEDEPVEPLLADYTYAVEKQLDVTVNTRDFFNEIWVIGLDERTQKPVIASYIDLMSMGDPTYENYVGQRRLMIYVNSALNRQNQVEWALEEFRKAYGVLRREVVFSARFDPLLLPGDYVRIHGMPETWKLLDVNPDFSRGNVVPRLDRTVHCQYTAREWPDEEPAEEEEEE